jgi:hypothetical protein
MAKQTCKEYGTYGCGEEEGQQQGKFPPGGRLTPEDFVASEKADIHPKKILKPSIHRI